MDLRRFQVGWFFKFGGWVSAKKLGLGLGPPEVYRRARGLKMLPWVCHLTSRPQNPAKWTRSSPRAAQSLGGVLRSNGKCYPSWDLEDFNLAEPNLGIPDLAASISLVSWHLGGWFSMQMRAREMPCRTRCFAESSR